MQNWLILDDDYLDALRTDIEPKIPYTDYGKDKIKPFFGVLFEKDDLYYVTQVSHFNQSKHARMKNAMDFRKIYIPSKIPGGQDIPACVLNLNYMFPIPKSLVKNLEYKDINKYRTFKSEQEKSKYIDLLRSELKAINAMNIEHMAKKLYNLRGEHPENRVSLRCFDFAKLERYAQSYMSNN